MFKRWVIANLLSFSIAASLWSYPIIRPESHRDNEPYAEDTCELVEAIPLSEHARVIREPATDHALGEVTIVEGRPDLRVKSNNRRYYLEWGFESYDGGIYSRGVNGTRSLVDENGNALWTEKVTESQLVPGAMVSDLGIVLKPSDDKQFLEWYDTSNKLLNRYPVNPYTTSTQPVNENGYWLMFEEPKDDPYAFLEPEGDGPTYYPMDFRYDVETNTFPSQSGVIIFDQYGNKLKQVELSFEELTSVRKSPHGDFFLVCAHPKTLLLSIDGVILREFNKSGGFSIAFSANEDVAFLYAPLNMVIDLRNGEFLAQVTHASNGGVVSNKEAGIVVTNEGPKMYVYDIWREKNVATFRHGGSYLQITGDGKLLSFVRDNTLVTYRLDIPAETE